ncbi:response regulator [Patescibacteria group bacterium]|nr:response regulator [Patescibacteria group bacterium]MBU4512699.1 response regulator [Patescibacteria group bacterium]MCG2693601.1 response regulator [Candidatus Parcubacteria bacterium]
MPTQESQKKVLIIEDEDMLSDMYKVKFEKEKFQFLRATEGSEGLEMAKREKPDVILLDVIMPKMDGFAVLQALKADSATKSARVILLTNLGQDEDIQKGKDMGADDYLVKANFTPTQVVEKVRMLLGRK